MNAKMFQINPNFFEKEERGIKTHREEWMITREKSEMRMKREP